MPGWNPLNRLWNANRENRIPSKLSSAVSGNDLKDQAFLRSLAKELHPFPNIEMPLEQLEVVVVDLETTGFYPQRGDEIISIGAVAMRGSQVLANESFSTLVNPGRAIPAHIEALTGITSQAVADAPDTLTALSRFFQFVGSRPLVAHHSRHEREFFRAALWKTSKSRFVHRLLDTMMLIRLVSRPMGNSSLDVFCAMHSIPIVKRHDAYQDALATAFLWGIYLDRAVKHGYKDLQQVYEEIGNLP
ncbi:3'-5' exonuclease [Brevibacillus sp. SYP-B805]|uniref:exonuclease domain-containing protein n=1 Tax=Brevibacillus sp. SYP-B805 TaxID=1578199 RepID=UPI0013EBC33B|nr:exonuclease domain-containing protein [Brevibacillus sp. SYP-B805]NGQ96654.1 3'-5' exonuclease [Brevibacillus sp. SYP-B805]